jgi:hypothetical protein
MWYVALSGRNPRSGTRNPRRCHWAGIYQAFSLAKHGSVLLPRNIFYMKNICIHYYICTHKIITREGLKHHPYDIAGAVTDWCKMISRMPGIAGARGKTRPNRIKFRHDGIALELKNTGSVPSRHFSE